MHREITDQRTLSGLFLALYDELNELNDIATKIGKKLTTLIKINSTVDCRFAQLYHFRNNFILIMFIY
jgi:hypothetical protein